ncbi:MAG: hypothetical protein ACI8W7_004551, partial [Gammaproteobacteria bacterium]
VFAGGSFVLLLLHEERFVHHCFDRN